MRKQRDGQGLEVSDVVDVTRREFLIGSTALGISGALGTSMVPRQARASTPKRGGTFRILITTQAKRNLSSFSGIGGVLSAT